MKDFFGGNVNNIKWGFFLMKSVSTKLEKIQNNKSLYGIYKTFVELNLCVLFQKYVDSYIKMTLWHGRLDVFSGSTPIIIYSQLQVN